MLLFADWNHFDGGDTITLSKQPLISVESNNFFHDGHNVS